MNNEIAFWLNFVIDAQKAAGPLETGNPSEYKVNAGLDHLGFVTATRPKVQKVEASFNSQRSSRYNTLTVWMSLRRQSALLHHELLEAGT